MATALRRGGLCWPVVCVAVVLPQAGRRRADVARCSGQHERQPGHDYPAALWVVHLRAQPVGADLRMVQPLVAFAERTGRTIALFEQREPLVAWARLEGVGQSLADPAAVLGCHEAGGNSRDALVGEKVADAKHAEGVRLELGVSAARNNQRPSFAW